MDGADVMSLSAANVTVLNVILSRNRYLIIVPEARKSRRMEDSNESGRIVFPLKFSYSVGFVSNV